LAGSWLIASVCIDRITQMSSAIRAMFGKSSLIHMPLFPCWANLNRLGARGNEAWRAVMPVSRSPWSFSQSLRSSLKRVSRCGL